MTSDAPERLTKRQRGLLVVLSLPAFGLALAYTVVTTYGPVLLNRLSGPTLAGVIIGTEGLLALIVPVAAGARSDRLHTRFGGRLPFIGAGAILAVAGLLLLPPLAGSLAGLVAAIAVFFVAYFVYYAPYNALFPDLVPHSRRGRSQGFLGGMRSAGLLLGMAGGGFLLELWEPLPFVVAAAAVSATTAALALGLRGRAGNTQGDAADTANPGGAFRAIWDLVGSDRRIRWWAVANACWEAAISSLRTFVVLYLTIGLGLSLNESSGALVLVGAAAVIAAPVAGRVADRYGARPVMRTAIWIFALGLTPPLLTTNTAFVAAIAPVAFAAVVLMTLPYAVLMGLLPDGESHGVGASVLEVSRGVGILAGPLLAGLSIAAAGAVPVLTFPATKGYSAIFAVSMVLLLASLPGLRRTRAA